MMNYHDNVHYLAPTRARPLVRNYEPPKPKVHSAATVLATFIVGTFVLVVGSSFLASVLSSELPAYLNSH